MERKQGSGTPAAAAPRFARLTFCRSPGRVPFGSYSATQRVALTRGAAGAGPANGTRSGAAAELGSAVNAGPAPFQRLVDSRQLFSAALGPVHAGDDDPAPSSAKWRHLRRA